VKLFCNFPGEKENEEEPVNEIVWGLICLQTGINAFVDFLPHDVLRQNKQHPYKEYKLNE
jgi:hypothetical protein